MPSDPVKSFPFLFYLQITSGTETRKERSSQTRKGRKRERKNDSQMQRWDRAADLSLSRSPSPFWPGLIVAAPCRSRSCLRANRDRSTTSRDLTSCRTQLPLSLSSFFSQFDRIWWYFFSGFCLCFCIEEWMILYIFLATEKMWENVSNKQKMCFLWYFQEYNQTPKNIFRNIFWNATKRMKIFSFSENIYFPKNILHETNTALASLFLPPLCCHTNLEWQREH